MLEKDFCFVVFGSVLSNCLSQLLASSTHFDDEECSRGEPVGRLLSSGTS